MDSRINDMQKNEPLISVVIPLYNIESYLDACIDSVVNQSWTNLEIILVDDGSADRSGQICEEWAARDPRIQVIHKENGGMSDARNAGIRQAHGDLIGLVDGDDVIHPHMYRKLYRLMQHAGADIACCSYIRGERFDWQENADQNIAVKKKRYPTEAAIRTLVLETGITSNVWDKLYKKQVLQKIPFIEGKYHEDEFWVYQVLGQASIIAFTSEILYGYRQRSGSIMHQRYSMKHLDLLDARAERLEWLSRYYPELTWYARCNLRFECIRAWQRCDLDMMEQDKIDGKKKARNVAEAYSVTKQDYYRLPAGRQFWLWLSNRSFVLTCKIRNQFHFGP